MCQNRNMLGTINYIKNKKEVEIRARLAALPIGIVLGAHEMHVMSPAREEDNQ